MRRIVDDFDNEWTPQLLDEVYEGIEELAVGEWNYNIFKNQIELVSDTGMLEAYATIGLPIMYHHWSFGKRFLSQSRAYRAGLMGLAYELVINSDPCIAYLMESNTLMMQTLVMAHACIGHNHFFKNNYMFKQWTQPDAIIDYLQYAKRYIARQEERHGIDKVELTLDAAHTLSHYSVDKYNKKQRTKVQLEADLKARLAWEDSQYDQLSSPFRERKKIEDDKDENVEETENLLYFIEKFAPNLEDWQREIVRIVRKIGQYFYPQRQLQLMNEGFATTSHYEIINELYDRGLVDERFMFEFIRSHSGVLGQQMIGVHNLRHLNPYKLGFVMFRDIRRRCEKPTKEDEYWFPDQVGRPFRDVYFEAVDGYKDESFVLQYLSPQTVREMRLMTLLDDDRKPTLQVSGIANDESFTHVRRELSRSYDLGLGQPHISIFDVDWKGSRTLKIRHEMHRRRPLDEPEARKVLRQVHRLWQFPISIESVASDGTTKVVTYP
jgi:stage V sporulation protein R